MLFARDRRTREIAIGNRMHRSHVAETDTEMNQLPANSAVYHGVIRCAGQSSARANGKVVRSEVGSAEV